MFTIDDYMDRARQRHGLTSDRALSRALGLGGPATNHWRTKRAWPADETMVKLAELADLPADQALLDLNLWREGDSAAGPVYQKIKSAIAKTAALILLSSGFFAGLAIGNGMPPANAGGTDKGDLSACCILWKI